MSQITIEQGKSDSRLDLHEIRGRSESLIDDIIASQAQLSPELVVERDGYLATFVRIDTSTLDTDGAYTVLELRHALPDTDGPRHQVVRHECVEHLDPDFLRPDFTELKRDEYSFFSKSHPLTAEEFDIDGNHLDWSTRPQEEQDLYLDLNLAYQSIPVSYEQAA